MSTDLMKLTGHGIAVAAFAAALALALPAQADFKISQDDFVALCNDTGANLFGTSYVAVTDTVTVTVADGLQLEVLKIVGSSVLADDDTDPGVIEHNCTVDLGEDSELNLGERTNLLFFCDAVCDVEEVDNIAGFKNFNITTDDPGFEIEVQVKKDSTIEARNFEIDFDGAEEAKAQFEENFCLRLHADTTEPFAGGNLRLFMNTGSDEGGDIQFNTFVTSAATFTDGECGESPNIIVDGYIFMSVGGNDSEIRIEEFNEIEAGGSITLAGNGLGSQVQTKKKVVLTILGLTAVFPSDDDLVAYWSFDDQSDPTSDDSGNGHDGTLGTAVGPDPQDPTYVTAAADKAPLPENVAALDFDAGAPGSAADDEFVDIADADALDLGTVARPAFTIAAWVNPDTISNADELGVTNPVIVGKDGSGVNERPYLLTAGNGGDGRATIFVSKSGGGNTFVQGPALPLNTWTHVAATYKFVADGTSELKIYVNGVLSASTVTAVGPLQDGAADFNIGRREFTTSHAPFNGLIDEVRIYDVALTAENIAALADEHDITLTAPDDGGEVQVEEDNDFDAPGDIVIFSDSKTEVKKLTDLDAGGTIDVESPGFCKIEAVIDGEWSAPPGGDAGIDTHFCDLAPSM